MIALARKYRPRTFAAVAVQKHVADTLKGAVAAGRVAHGYLLAGPRGVGKTTLARVLAMALNCERGAPGGEPCGECPSCTRIWAGSTSLDVVEIDAASNRGVDDARELRERAMYAPSGDQRYKVYIVDEAHMLTREAWNALLKILEEPPPRVVFVFATTEPHKIAQAAAPVLSRLQRFDFKRIGPAEIRARLESVLAQEQVSAESEALMLIARVADGSMRDALSLADQVLTMGDGTLSAARVREALGLIPEDEFVSLLDLIAERRAADVFPLVGRLADAGMDFGQFVIGLGDILRAQLAVELGGDASDVSDHTRQALAARRGKIPAADLLRMLNLMAEGELRFKRSSQQQLLVEMLLVRFALLDRTLDLESVLNAIGGTPGAESSSGGARATDAGRARAAPADSPSVARDVVPPRPVASVETAPTAPAAATSPTSPTSPAAPAAQSAPAAPDAPLPPLPPPRPLSLSTAAGTLPDINAVTGRWDELVTRVRGSGKALLAAALEASSPVAISSAGDLTIELDEPNDFHARAIEQSKHDVLAILSEWFKGTHGIRLFREAGPPVQPTERADERPPDRPRRMTDEMARSERLNALRRKDPLLGAAIDALDLELDE